LKSGFLAIRFPLEGRKRIAEERRRNALLISQRLPAIAIRQRQWTGRKAPRDRGLAAPEFIQEFGHCFSPLMAAFMPQP
jgi:hypothetical protein